MAAVTANPQVAQLQITGGAGLVGAALLSLTCFLLFSSGVVIGGLMIAEDIHSHGEIAGLFIGPPLLAVSSGLCYLFAGIGVTSIADFFQAYLLLSNDSIWDRRFMDSPLDWDHVERVTIAYNARHQPNALRIQTLSQNLPVQTRFRIGCLLGQRPHASVISLHGLSVPASEIITLVRQSARTRNIAFFDPHAGAAILSWRDPPVQA